MSDASKRGRPEGVTPTPVKGKKGRQGSDEQEDGAGTDQEKDDEIASAILPLAWRMEQQAMEERMMRNMRVMMEEIVGGKVKEMNDTIKDLRDEVQQVKGTAFKANETASAAHEVVRALKAEFAKESQGGGGAQQL